MRRIAGFIAILLLLLEGAAVAYEEDTHYYLCYILARLGGMEDRPARIVAGAAQAVDDSPATMPYRADNVAISRPLATAAVELARINEVLPRWHAIQGPEGDDGVRRRMVEMYTQAREGNDLIAFGRFAHYLQDYFSHQKDGERFSAPLGHFLRGSLLSDLISERRWPRDVLGHSPDYLATDPKKAKEMADAWLARVRLFLKETGRGEPGPKDPATDKLIRETIGVLIAARQQGLSHAETEQHLNDLFRREGLDLTVAPYRERLSYVFDADGKVIRIDPAKDAPSLPMPYDEAGDRAMRRTLQEAAQSGKLPAPSGRELLRSFRALEQIELGDTLKRQVEAKLEQLRQRLDELRTGADKLRAELGPLATEISQIEGKLRNLTDLDLGPCACGVATHRQCKSKKTCDPAEAELVRLAKAQLDTAVTKREEKQKLIAAAGRARDAGEAELAAWEKRRVALPSDGSGTEWLSPELRSRLVVGIITTRSLRAALPGILPYLPEGAVVSSGYRSPEKQLALIREFAAKHGVPWKEGADIDRPETWIQAWRTLREKKGVIINPPVSATLSDGRKVHASPHTRGNSFDVAGAPLDKIEAALRKAQGDGKGSFTLLAEPVNNCVHVQLPD